MAFTFPVLVVDSHPDSATSLADYLGLRGFDARPAVTAADALARVVGWHPAAAVIHLRLSGLDGCTLARLLAERCPRPPVLVATTGLDTADARARAAAAGFAHFLVKPIDPGELADVLTGYATGGA